MKKLSLFLVIIIVLATGLVFSDLNAHARDAKPIRLLFGNFAPEVEVAIVPAMKAWAKELEERSDGRVNVEFSWGSALGPFPEFYEMLRAGVCDIAHINPPAMAPGLFPMSEVIGLPWAFPSAVSTVEITYKLYELGYFDKEFSEIKVAYISAMGGCDFLKTSTKPVKNLSDIKGLKVNCADESTASIVKALGGVPVFLAPPEVYPALQKGTVDGNYPGSWSNTVGAFRWFEVLNYAIEPGLGNGIQVNMINMGTWDRLSPDIQSIIKDISMKYGIESAANTDRIDKEAVRQCLDRGWEISRYSDKDLDEMDQRFTPIWQKWIDKQQAKGLPAKEVLNLVWKLLKEQGVERPAVGYRPARGRLDS